MADVDQIKKGKATTARKRGAHGARREVLEAKPAKLDHGQFERLCKSVTNRIPRTLAILAK